MLTKEKIKIFAFGIMATAFAWLAYSLKGKGDLLDQALCQIDSARTQMHLAQGDIGNAQFKVDSAQIVLGKMYAAADKAQKELDDLQVKRNRLYGEIGSAIKTSRQNLGILNDSLQSMMNRQNRLLNQLDSIGIHTVYIESHKNN